MASEPEINADGLAVQFLRMFILFAIASDVAGLTVTYSV